MKIISYMKNVHGEEQNNNQFNIQCNCNSILKHLLTGKQKESYTPTC